MFTSNQIAALRYMIFNAKEGTEFSKRVLAFLVESSENLTKEVCFTLVADREGYTEKAIRAAAYGISKMQSCNGTTHIDQILNVMGSDFGFSVHYGDFDPTRTGDLFNNDGQFAGIDRSRVSRDGLIREDMSFRYTFWLSKVNYSQQVTLIVAGCEKLEQINLKKPGLYPSLEPAA